MAVSIWLLASFGILLAWGITGIFQKLASNHISAPSTIVWQSVAFCLFLPFFYPSESLWTYSAISLIFGLLSGFLTNLGTLFLVAAMGNGGKASIVAPITTLFPLLVVLLAPLILKESFTLAQGAGMLSAFVAIYLLAE